jgi:nascent polypeptide-associated complex subunit alpha
MKQMGMNMNEHGDINRVILQGNDREIVIEGPQVTSINVQGTKMYQIAGGREIEMKQKPVHDSKEEGEILVIPEEDILLVAQQANVSIEVAKRTLKECDGDLAQAIIKLQTR